MRIAVVGGGILGVATARALAGEHEVVVLEKEPALAQHQSSRNSGVVHAGIYYAAGSLKARLCRAGGERLRAFCETHALRYEACGKVVVARDGRELERLKALEERAAANGVPGLARLDEAELHALEPHARGVAALHSPSSAIVDFGAVVRAMADELARAGGQIRLRARVGAVRAEAGRVAVELADGSRIDADRAVVCAGLYADRLARASGGRAAPRIVPFRGEFWRLRRERRDLVRGLIYPVPDPSLPFLGVHFTPRVDGEVWIGPNAVLALAREGYGWASVSARDLIDTLTWPGTWRMAGRHWRTAFSELAGSISKRRYLHDARTYIPELAAADVTRAPAGVRAQALDADGTLVDDFRLESAGPIVWVRNAPSPAATSSLAIADELADICVRKHLSDTL